MEVLALVGNQKPGALHYELPRPKVQKYKALKSGTSIEKLTVLHTRAWIHVLDAHGCYKCAARAERKSTLQGLGFIRTVALCSQRVALMPQAIARARDTLSYDWSESAAHFKRPAEQTLALATKPRAKREARSVLYHTCTYQ